MRCRKFLTMLYIAIGHILALVLIVMERFDLATVVLAYVIIGKMEKNKNG